MRLTCPGCGAQYEIAAADWPCTTDAGGARQPRPRRARCHRCETVWEALPDADPAAAAPAAGNAEDWRDWDDWDDAPRRRRWRWWGALAAVSLLLAGGLGLDRAGVLDRRQLPPLPAIDFGAVHLPAFQLPAFQLPDIRIALPRAAVPPLTVELAPLHIQQAAHNQIWEVQGSVRNPTAQAQPLPPVEIRLLDAQGKVVVRTLARAAAAELAAGERQDFATSLVDPAHRGARVQARLRPAELARP